MSIDCSQTLYQRGLNYLYGFNGQHQDYKKAADYFLQGYKQGDLNSAYMLCECYYDGIGVAMDLELTIRLAEELVSKNFFPACYILSDMWGTGRGVPMDQQKAKEFADKLEKNCSQPINGIDEGIRYRVLWCNEYSKTTPDFYQLRRIARENFSKSDWPDRFGILASTLIKDIEDSPSATQEVHQLLDEGCKQGDFLSCFLKGTMLCEDSNPIFTPNKHTGLKLLKKAADGGLPLALYHYALQQDNNDLLDKFWETCQLGLSCIPGKKELNCFISLVPASSACYWHVYEKSITEALLNQNQIDQLVNLLPPVLVLKNLNPHTLYNLKVRICCKDIQLDRTIDLPAPLSPGGCLEINPLDYDLTLGEQLYVEVRSGDRCSRMELETINGTSDFMQEVPPLMLFWERGFFGGYILKLASMNGRISNVQVRKTRNQAINEKPVTLFANKEPASIGWCEFNDSEGLKDNEVFFVESAEYPPIVGQILTMPGAPGNNG